MLNKNVYKPFSMAVEKEVYQKTKLYIANDIRYGSIAEMMREKMREYVIERSNKEHNNG